MANFSVQAGTLASSSNYVWNVADELGKGASAVVYLGRHKETGKEVAVKVFDESHVILATHGRTEMRELELLRRLRHQNVVTLESIEQTSTGTLVVIMEYCEGGSVYHMLDQPRYSNGLPESEYLSFLQHIAAGMKYLHDLKIVHRDIKPGNILRAITEEGTSVYKLTDFGAGRELGEEENFTSLYGTEEYLHPHIYERAVLRQQTHRTFDAKVDLWSLGVTLYHVATGKLPFRAHGGRQDRETMFRIISQKSSDAISGLQTHASGPIVYSENLPLTCPLSRGLKSRLTPLLALLMENDDARVISYAKFFEVVRSIGEDVSITVFDSVACQDLELYLNRAQTLPGLKEAIARESEICGSDQLLLVSGGTELEELVGTEMQILSYPTRVLRGTIYLYARPLNENRERTKIRHFPIPAVPDFTGKTDAVKDWKRSGYALARAHLIRRYGAETIEKQVRLVEGERCLRTYLEKKVDGTVGRLLSIEALMGEFSKRVEMLLNFTDLANKLLDSSESPGKTLSVSESLRLVLQKAMDRTVEIRNYYEGLTEVLCKSRAENDRWCARCREDSDCLTVVDHHLNSISAIHNRFRRDKNVKDQMTRHDQNIHDIVKEQLQNESVLISSVLESHCRHNLGILYSEAMDKVDAMGENFGRVSKIEKNIEAVTYCHELMSKKLEKCEKKVYDALEGATLQASGHKQTSLPLATGGAEGGEVKAEGYIAKTDKRTAVESLQKECSQIGGVLTENTDLMKSLSHKWCS